MQSREVISKLEKLSPPMYAEPWDNIGLLVGRMDKEVNRIFIALDPTEEALEECITCGADMLVTHHPLIFAPVKCVNAEDFLGRRIMRLIQKDISCYAMHTNFDVKGMADAAADKMRLADRTVLEVTHEDGLIKEGMGRTGTLPRTMTLEECADYVKNCFQLKSVKVFGPMDKILKTAAIMPGSGKSSVEIAFQKGCDVLITGDMDHHGGLDAVAQGMAVIDAGHYGLEKIFISYLKEYLERETKGITIFTKSEKNPFCIL